MEKSDFRPHIVKLRRSTLIQMTVGEREILELQEEVRVMIFCWQDIPALSDESFLRTELQKMDSGIKTAYNDLQKIIDGLNR